MLRLEIILITAGLALLFAAVLAIAIMRWRKKQQVLQLEANMRLLKRCLKIDDLLSVLADRYIPLSTKMMLVDYVIASMEKVKSLPNAFPLTEKHEEYVGLRSELMRAEQATKNEKVAVQAEFVRVQGALRVLLTLVKAFSANRMIDKASAKQQMSMIRYGYQLAHCDLLVKEAQEDLDLEKNARALEKYRTALSEMESVSFIPESNRVINTLKNRIQMVEGILFKKKQNVDQG
ncbi:hypothetical protein [Marinomonas balearica]|uniref:Uncharacterized protein n=1 Tax=Marinomonas balearica TaxID=491947 RepID=A0A4R6MCT1_9GAMM|nr:hypothetical protein [Marinomonas balearica]TDO99471.1 hypothetical protein DFP79_0454 [Marinomonas balearica]